MSIPLLFIAMGAKFFHQPPFRVRFKKRLYPDIRRKNPFSRETVEFFFESGKQKTDGTRTRVWSSECLMGRMFTQFIALCYYEYLSEQLRQMKESLSVEINGPEAGTADEKKTKKKLLTWLKNTPVYLTLQWFDVVEEVKVSSQLIAKRWPTEITERDKLFLDRLGVPAF